MRMLYLGAFREHLYSTAPNPPNCPFYKCSIIQSGRCTVADLFGISKSGRPVPWIAPNFSLVEGPVMHGLTNPYCQDCLGCESELLHCHADVDSSASSSPSYSGCERHMNASGGYVSVEYARDVEIQSTTRRTTQENFVHYLATQWNVPPMVRDLGRVVCVVNTGIHDWKIPNITTEAYLKNVREYLRLLSEQCVHVVWVGNTSPQTDLNVQKIDGTQRWNLGVLDLLRTITNGTSGGGTESSSVSWPSYSFIDVFEASRKANYFDNIHMHPSWYDAFGAMFRNVVEEVRDETRFRTDLDNSKSVDQDLLI
jgi:hypothetical protein